MYIHTFLNLIVLVHRISESIPSKSLSLVTAGQVINGDNFALDSYPLVFWVSYSFPNPSNFQKTSWSME